MTGPQPADDAAGPAAEEVLDDVDCRQVVEQVYLYLDGELDDDHVATLRGHLDDCVSCLRAYGLEREVKALVARCCGSDLAPAELRSKVLSSLRLQVQVTETFEFRLD